MNTDIKGLTTEEVQMRMTGRDSRDSGSITKTRGQIYKENILTLFNLLNFTIAALLFIAGAYTNMLFIAIIITNIAVGITQELKAKKLVDELSLLNRPVVTVIRDGVSHNITPEEVVTDDIVVLGSGRQIVNDAVVVSGSMEVNESLLTGESDGVVKEVGSELLSGSLVISGKCYARVTHVGGENYANKLADEVKKEKQVCSELLDSMRRVTKFTSFLIVPLGILLFIEAMVVRGAAFDTAVVSSSAALLGMLPKGLVLLISVSLANGVIRLSKQKILVQNIYALETLAHVDVVCLDKTGTLTDGKLSVHETEWIRGGGFPGEEKARELLSAYLGASEDNNATIEALRSHAAVMRSCIPLTKLRAFICVSMVVGIFGGLFVLHNLFEVSAVTAAMAVSTLFVFAMGMVILSLLLLGKRRLEMP